MDGLAAFYQAPTICLKCSAQFCRSNFSPGWKQPYYRWSPKTPSTLGLKPRTPVWCSFHDSSLSPENSQEAQWVELGCPWEVRKRGRGEWGEDKKRKERKGGVGETFTLLQREMFINSGTRERQGVRPERGTRGNIRNCSCNGLFLTPVVIFTYYFIYCIE